MTACETGEMIQVETQETFRRNVTSCSSLFSGLSCCLSCAPASEPSLLMRINLSLRLFRKMSPRLGCKIDSPPVWTHYNLLFAKSCGAWCHNVTQHPSRSAISVSPHYCPCLLVQKLYKYIEQKSGVYRSCVGFSVQLLLLRKKHWNDGCASRMSRRHQCRRHVFAVLQSLRSPRSLWVRHLFNKWKSLTKNLTKKL